MKKCLLLLSGLFFITCSFAQDMNGRWVGNYTRSFVMSNPEKVVVEMVVTDTIVSGSSHLYYPDGDYEHYTIKGIYNKRDSLISFFEDSTLGLRLGPGVQNCLGLYKMKLRIRDSIMQLEGRWFDNEKDDRCPPLGVWFSKKVPPRPIPREKDKNLDRPIVSQSLIEIDPAEKDNIRIAVVDNAQIDNDAVSIYVNDEPVAKKQLLSKEPIEFVVSVSRDKPLCRIVMAAESMGSVPPCTALMRVTVGKQVHQVTLSSNMGTSGSLELFLKE